MAESECPCGTNKSYDTCCGRFHAGVMHATTAEELMRSHYSAFVRMNDSYLASTWHPKTRPRVIHLSTGRLWTGLEILATKDGGPLNDSGVVEFAAHYVEDGVEDTSHQVSEFVRVDGKWTYVDEARRLI